MFNRTVFSIFHWNKASFRFQLSRIRQVLLLLVLLSSLVGMQPTRVNAAMAATRLNNLEACTPVRIMPLGDSITYDYHEPEIRPSSERTGYRLPLWELLIEGGYSVDFVGSRSAGEALGQDLVPPFDPDNEGHSGWTDDQIAANIYNWLAATPADVVLLHIGTNYLDTSPDDVEDILDEIDRWEADSGNPVTVLLARIINRSIYSADTTTFNDNVAAMAEARSAAGDQIIVIDMENGAGLDYSVDNTLPYNDGDLYDYLHPNDAGYAKMASAWFNGDSSGSPALADILPVCVSQTDPEPLGHWTFDESTWAGDCSTADILDSSGNNRHGTACIDGDAPFPVPGKFGNAGRFDGIDQYANMGPGFNFTSSFTAALWIALDDYDWCGPTGKSQHIIGTHHLATPAGNGRGWGIYWDCSGLAWELTNSDGSAIGSYGYVQPSPFPENGSWHHAALVYDSTVPSATLYWDGAPIYSERGVANVPGFLFNNGEPLTINGLPYAPSAGAPGKIDDTRVFNRALSAAQIQRLFDDQPPVAETPTFTDVPSSHPYFTDIEILYANGLTGGCVTTPLKFCPDQIMDRAQAAVFMLRGSLGVGYTPPAVAAHIFADNWAPGLWAEKWAEGMYQEGMTAGCTTSGPLKFCPWDLTPREQAAIFGLRLKYGNDYTPPAATGTLFADMTNTGYYATKWAEQAYKDGLIPACGTSGGKPKFCPSELVSRGLAAYMIVRAKDLTMP